MIGLFAVFSTLQAGAPGDFDTSFSGDGFDAVTTGNLSHYGEAIALQPDGKIVVGGTQQDAFVVLRYNPNGTLDTTFGGGDGTVVTFFSDDSVDAVDMVLQPDGKIILIGTEDESNLIMARYMPNGKLDETFADNGKFNASLLPGGDTQSSSIVMLPNGKFMVSGRAIEEASDHYDFFLARFKANGKPDKTFGDGDGVVLTDFANDWDYAADIVRLSDGKFVVVGSAGLGEFNSSAVVVRYNANGTLDTTFGDGDGIVFLDDDLFASKVIILSGGKLLLGGSTNGDFLLVQLLENGNPDPAFGGGDGIAIHDLGVSASINDLARLPGGNIVAIGKAVSTLEQIAIARFNSQGDLDLSFSGDGQILLDGGGHYNSGTAVAVQPDGKIVFTGYMELGNQLHIYTARLHNETLRNASFEKNNNGDTLPDYWKGKQLSNDTLLCGNAKNPAHSGQCTFRLRGDKDGKRERLFQDFNVAGSEARKFRFSAFIESNGLPADSALLSVEFWLGTTRINRTEIPVTERNSDGYVELSGTATAEGAYDKVRVGIELKATKGRMLVDSLSLTRVIEEALPLQLPEAPDSTELRLAN